MGIGPRVYKREEMERNICTHMYVYGVGTNDMGVLLKLFIGKMENFI